MKSVDRPGGDAGAIDVEALRRRFIAREADFAGRRSVALSAESLRGVDAALVATDHAGVDYRLVAAHCPLVVDTRNVCAAAPNVVRA